MRRTVQDVPVFILENEHASATITPQWGGKVWDFFLKVPRATPLLFTNPIHQSVNSGVLKAYTAGGIEWNWSPGKIGHSVFTESPVHLAKVETSRGDIARIYEFDRFNGSVWQVDLFLEGTTLWVHPTVHNPSPHPIPGYWWTNAGVPTTTEAGVCRPRKGLAYGQKGSRCLVNADKVISNAAGAHNLAPWPRYTESCCAGDMTVPQGVEMPDLSYLSHHLTDIDHFFVTARAEGAPHAARPWVAMVDRTVYSDEVHGVFHGHDLNGTKMWSWGQNQLTDWTQTLRDDGAGSGWGGCFSEQQTGVRPTQSQAFELRGGGSLQWTEFFKGMTGLRNGRALYSENYTEAIIEATRWLESDAGVNETLYKAMDAWLASHADDLVGESDVLSLGQPWGALEVEAGASLPKSTAWPEQHTNESSQWWELLRHGTFSNATLSQPTPLSFATTSRWLDLVGSSAAKHGSTWLHEVHLGVGAAEMSDLPTARMHFRAALASPANPAIAHRSLAVMETDAAMRVRLYEAAWEAAKAQGTGEVALRLRRNLAAEISQYYLVTGDHVRLSRFIGTLETDEEREADLTVRARISVHLHRNESGAARALLLNHSFPTVSLYRDEIIALWDRTWQLEQEMSFGRRLTAVERRHLRAAHPVPGSLGARQEWPNKGGKQRQQKM